MSGLIASNAGFDELLRLDDRSRLVHRRVVGWLEQAVIQLRLCPFAAPVHRGGRLGIGITWSSDEISLLIRLEREIVRLSGSGIGTLESVLIVMPDAFARFDAFNQFLDRVDETLAMTGSEGEIQVASFHPDYQFGDEAPDSPANNSNRAPYPVWHLLREESVARATRATPTADDIVAHNRSVLAAMGHQGWAALSAGWSCDIPDGNKTPDGSLADPPTDH